jgi:hypothetical protein
MHQVCQLAILPDLADEIEGTEDRREDFSAHLIDLAASSCGRQLVWRATATRPASTGSDVALAGLPAELLGLRPCCNLRFVCSPGWSSGGWRPAHPRRRPAGAGGHELHEITGELDDDCRTDDRDLPISDRSPPRRSTRCCRLTTGVPTSALEPAAAPPPTDRGDGQLSRGVTPHDGLSPLLPSCHPGACSGPGGDPVTAGPDCRRPGEEQDIADAVSPTGRKRRLLR